LLGNPGNVICGDYVVRVVGPEALGVEASEGTPGFAHPYHAAGGVAAEWAAAGTATASTYLGKVSADCEVHEIP
jgi:hypothetical protein